MTENNKVSALAFFVLILGMLGFIVAVAVDLVLSTGAPAVVAPATPTVPRELQNSVMQDRAHAAIGLDRNSEFDVTGSGQVLPEERAQRVEELICCHMSFERGGATFAGSLSKRIGEKGWMIDWGMDWPAVKESLYSKPQNHSESHR